jgi:hypothetical protein
MAIRGLRSTVSKRRIRFSGEVVVPAVGGPDGRDALLSYLVDRIEDSGGSVTRRESATVSFSGAPNVFYRWPTLVGINRGELTVIQLESGVSIHYWLDYSGTVGIAVVTFVLFGVSSITGGEHVSGIIAFPAIGVLLAAVSTWRSMSRFRSWLTRECRRWLTAPDGSALQKQH